ncbi:MAG: hypothetical protein MH204_05525, partial [Fimbriimonadaceae bacterium]|nr:hypothetical protein [Fimbriimonadaceae bacterium]
PAERWGLSGLLGMGLVGTLVLAAGSIPGSLGILPWALFALVLILAAVRGIPADLGFEQPTGLRLAVLGSLIGLGLVVAVAVLAPSTMTDWDSLAYHLAVPKLWLAQGSIGYVPALHQSNFPFAADNLFILGLGWGGESGAKAFMAAGLLFGVLWLFGVARRWHGDSAGWLAALGGAFIPVVAWEAGTAYIDHMPGFYAVLAAVYGIEAMRGDGLRRAGLAGIALGLCLGTKYTGLQVAAALAPVLIVVGFSKKSAGFRLKPLVIGLALAVLVGGAWYVRNAVQTGNPVYPFFHSVFGGREWDDRRAEIYAREQASFGIAKAPANLGHAVLGLAYQPGRYVNPGQQVGAGFPTGGIGFASVAVLFAAAALGRLRGRDAALAGFAALLLLMWFVLSQQSRYLAVAALPAILAGVGAFSGSAQLRRGLGALFGLQAAVTLGFLVWFQTMDQVAGLGDADTYRAERVPLARMAPKINALPPDAKIALYDEVFGFLLDRSYMWANPGHSTLIPYDSMESGSDLVDGLAEMGFTHAFVNLQFQDREFVGRWLSSMGLGQGEGIPDEEREAMMANWEIRWKALLAEAVAEGRLRLAAQEGPGLLFELDR